MQVDDDKPLFGRPKVLDRLSSDDQPMLEPKSSQPAKRQAISEGLYDTDSFRNFEDKTLEEQANYITKALVFGEDMPLFSFDSQDRIKKRELEKSLTGGIISLLFISVIDMRVLKRMKNAQKMGPLRKFLLINLLNMPVYVYFYQDFFKKYLNLEKHLVNKYLILGDEMLYKKRISNNDYKPPSIV